jgi:lipopolysaccharide/colanic/teichoic acid biosynthesis glycosyltransferase
MDVSAGSRVRGGVEACAAAVVLVVLAPVVLLIALAVRLTSPGPALFRQERLGRDRRPFTLFKFRSMSIDSDDTIHREYVTRLLRGEKADGGQEGVYKLTDDPRVTPLGRVLRRTSLDELPQLFNVVRGEMALVGPRPVLAWEAEQFPAWAESRFDVRPGITGLWQVQGRSAVAFLDALALDVEYVERKSLRADVAILLKTPAVLLDRRKAR